MTLGEPGGAGETGYFYQPNDVLVTPEGNIFVADGHGGTNSRILKFSSDGTLIRTIGESAQHECSRGRCRGCGRQHLWS